jgi:bifunctional DNA-binding transcriptional regulator/antitoxin component of YhaV-PrlF toxin-antitoxin module
MPSRHVRVGSGGRVVSPAESRKALGVQIGDDMVIELKADEVRLPPPITPRSGAG